MAAFAASNKWTLPLNIHTPRHLLQRRIGWHGEPNQRGLQGYKIKTTHGCAIVRSPATLVTRVTAIIHSALTLGTGRANAEITASSCRHRDGWALRELQPMIHPQRHRPRGCVPLLQTPSLQARPAITFLHHRKVFRPQILQIWWCRMCYDNAECHRTKGDRTL